MGQHLEVSRSAMRRYSSFVGFICMALSLLCLLAGCQGPAAPALPTATLLPTQAIPTATATFLPPPTVTPYPSPTMRGAEGVVPQADALTAAPGAPSTSASVAQGTPIPVATAPPSPSPAPTLTPTVSFVNLPAGISLGGATYSSDFQTGWPSFNDPTAKIAIRDDQYHFEIGPFDGRYFTTTALNQGNLYAQVEVTPETCPDKTGYGLMFHFEDASNYYLLTIFCDSSYTAVAKVAGSVVALSYGNLPTDLDPKQEDVHHLGVLAHGNDYTLYLEGQSIGSFNDTQFPKGDVAIYAVSQGNKVLKVSFDNLKVWSVQ
jgi:hypothetical protein